MVVKLVIVQKNYMCIFIKEKILAVRIRHGTVAKKRVRSTRLYSFFFCMRSLSPLLSSSHHIIGNPKRISFFIFSMHLLWLFIYLICCFLFSVPQNNKVLRLCFFFKSVPCKVCLYYLLFLFLYEHFFFYLHFRFMVKTEWIENCVAGTMLQRYSKQSEMQWAATRRECI